MMQTMEVRVGKDPHDVGAPSDLSIQAARLRHRAFGKPVNASTSARGVEVLGDGGNRAGVGLVMGRVQH